MRFDGYPQFRPAFVARLPIHDQAEDFAAGQAPVAFRMRRDRVEVAVAPVISSPASECVTRLPALKVICVSREVPSETRPASSKNRKSHRLSHLRRYPLVYSHVHADPGAGAAGLDAQFCTHKGWRPMRMGFRNSASGVRVYPRRRSPDCPHNLSSPLPQSTAGPLVKRDRLPLAQFVETHVHAGRPTVEPPRTSA